MAGTSYCHGNGQAKTKYIFKNKHIKFSGYISIYIYGQININLNINSCIYIYIYFFFLRALKWAQGQVYNFK